MFILFLVTVKLSICAAILIFSGLLAQNTLLIRVFTHPLANYHMSSFWYIVRTSACSIFAILYDLKLNLTENTILIQTLEILLIQIVFITVGYTFLNQAIERTKLVCEMKEKLTTINTLSMQEKMTSLQSSMARSH